MAEGGLHVRAFHVFVWGVAFLQLGNELVLVESLRVAVIEVEADGGVEHLLAHVQGSAEILGSLGFLG